MPKGYEALAARHPGGPLRSSGPCCHVADHDPDTARVTCGGAFHARMSRQERDLAHSSKSHKLDKPWPNIRPHRAECASAAIDGTYGGPERECHAKDHAPAHLVAECVDGRLIKNGRGELWKRRRTANPHALACNSGWVAKRPDSELPGTHAAVCSRWRTP